MKNIRIGSKIICVVLLLAVVTLSAVGYAVMRMSSIESNYAGLIDGAGAGSVLMARANRMVATTRADLYAVIAEDDQAEIGRLIPTLDQDQQKFHEFIDKSKTAMPQDAAKLDSLAADYDKVFVQIKAAAALGAAQENQKAMDLVHGAVRGPLADLIKKVAAQVDSTIADMNAQSDAATASTRSTIVLTLVLVGIGLLLGVLAALFVARSGIVKPIAAMTAAMQALAGGDKSVEIPGTDRRDEVGDHGEDRAGLQGQHDRGRPPARRAGSDEAAD